MTRNKIIFLGYLLLGNPLFAADQAFVVADLPKEPPVEGQLGEPGAPALKEQQAALAKSLLSKGICNEGYYGVTFCSRQESKSFKVSGELKGIEADTEIIPENQANAEP